MTRFDFVVYAESRRVDRRPGEVGHLEPTGLRHAARLEDTATLCERPTAGLAEFPRLAFALQDSDQACPYCLATFRALDR